MFWRWLLILCNKCNPRKKRGTVLSHDWLTMSDDTSWAAAKLSSISAVEKTSPVNPHLLVFAQNKLI